VRVSAILPLTERSDLPIQFGTRHRAAIGLTERTDALVLIVSEERGEVAVAHQGNIETVKDVASLEARLRGHTGMASDSAHKTTNDLRTAVFAFCLSLMVVSSVWYSYSLGFVRSLTTVEVPIEFIKRDSRLEIIESSSTAVRIQLSGSLQLISRLDPSQIKVRFDLSQAVAGRNSLSITEDDIILPPGASLKKVEPNSIDVTVDVLDQKSLPLQVDWTGALPPGILVQEIKLEPATVKVTGGQLLLNQIDTLYTAKVPVDGLKQSGEIRTSLALVPASLRLAPGQENSILIRYTVRPRRLIVPP
jgi:YbbR domain-containing protein